MVNTNLDDPRLEGKSPIIKVAYKMLRYAMDRLLNGDCSEDELAYTIETMNKLGTDYVHPNEFLNYDKAMELLGYGNNRVGFLNLMRKHNIKNEVVNNVKIGFSRTKILALKTKLKNVSDKKR